MKGEGERRKSEIGAFPANDSGHGFVAIRTKESSSSSVFRRFGCQGGVIRPKMSGLTDEQRERAARNREQALARKAAQAAQAAQPFPASQAAQASQGAKASHVVNNNYPRAQGHNTVSPDHLFDRGASHQQAQRYPSDEFTPQEHGSYSSYPRPASGSDAVYRQPEARDNPTQGRGERGPTSGQTQGWAHGVPVGGNPGSNHANVAGQAGRSYGYPETQASPRAYPSAGGSGQSQRGPSGFYDAAPSYGGAHTNSSKHVAGGPQGRAGGTGESESVYAAPRSASTFTPTAGRQPSSRVSNESEVVIVLSDSPPDARPAASSGPGHAPRPAHAWAGAPKSVANEQLLKRSHPVDRSDEERAHDDFYAEVVDADAIDSSFQSSEAKLPRPANSFEDEAMLGDKRRWRLFSSLLNAVKSPLIVCRKVQ